MIKKCFKLLVLVFMLGFPSASCCFAESKFKVGFSLPLTGPFAEFGSAVESSLKLAKEKEPELFSSVEIILEDDAYNAKNAVGVFKKFKDLDQVQLVIVWGNEPALAIAPLAEKSELPLVAFGQTPEIAANRSNVVRILGPASEFGTPIAQYLNSNKATSVKMILLENSFYRLVSESLEKGLNRNVAFNNLATVPATETDFRSYLIKVKSSPEDYLGVFLAPGQLLPFFKQANELGIKNPIFGSTSFESKSVITEARELMNGAVYAHVGVDAIWKENYLKRFGNDIQVSYAAVAYDTILTILRIIKQKNGELSGKSVIETLASVPEQEGVAGKFRATSSVKDGRYIEFDVQLKKIVNGTVQNIGG